jgi:hypothetical protein
VTDSTSSGSTTSGTPGSEGAAAKGEARAQLDASELISEMVSYGKELLDRVQERASKTTELVREKGYDADQWVSDVEWFWDSVKNDAVRAAKYWAERYPGR